jgi:hypothetical protein
MKVGADDLHINKNEMYTKGYCGELIFIKLHAKAIFSESIQFSLFPHYVERTLIVNVLR